MQFRISEMEGKYYVFALDSISETWIPRGSVYYTSEREARAYISTVHKEHLIATKPDDMILEDYDDEA